MNENKPENKPETCLHCGVARKEHDIPFRCCPRVPYYEPDDRPAMRERIAELEKKAEALLDVVKRIRGWDHLDGAGDGPFWKRELDAAIALAAALAGEKP